MTGFFNVYKEAGYTSHDVVAIVRKLTGAKAGHTGTLDPQAEGVLPVCIGRATKLADMITGQEKSYVAEVILGVTTDTGDMTGQELSRSPVQFNEDAVCKAVEGFLGPQTQIPPMYSALKIGGKRLYELARKGQTVERKPRAVNISAIRVVEYRPENNSFVIDVTCSKGTYIRSLCMDIGEVLGTGAAMGSLLRTRSGAFYIDAAVRLSRIKEAVSDGSISELLLNVEDMLAFPRAFVQAEGMTMAKNGNPVPLELVDMSDAVMENTEQHEHDDCADKVRLYGHDYCSGKVWLHGPDGLIGLFKLNSGSAKLRLEVML
ncbi:MAG: tRNA pseudouridine(55) synthase TruB [Defluviitaleaceae bacterium]|nr:tRNA pseudouridine(55) synthase TruB [Defluviitaleaceae bacterium]